MRHTLAEMRHDPLAIRQRFETGACSDKVPTRRLPEEAHVLALPQEVRQCQRWVEETGQKIIILFEGRDATRKGGTIKRFMQRMKSPYCTGYRAAETIRTRTQSMVFPALHRASARFR